MRRYYCRFCGIYTNNVITTETGETSYSAVMIAVCKECSEVKARWETDKDEG